MKKLVLFVDDDPKILAGLRRSLRGLRNEWEMVFTEGGEAALEQCGRASFDAVVSDARMPGMEGPVLLGKVRELYPDAARFILSGHCSRGSVLDCVAVAHQFLNKPCESETLTSALRAVFKMREAFPDKTTRQTLSRIQWLPSPSRLWTEVAAESPGTTVGDLAAVIGRDVGMSAKVVQLVSSGFFGSPQRVASPAEAVRFLGLETVCSLFARPADFATEMDPRRDESLERMNEHSLAVAATARRIAETLTEDRAWIGDAYLAGLLHEMGTLALGGGEGGCGDPSDWTTAAGFCENSVPDPGAYLAALWGLPEPVVQAIAFHRVPRQYGGEPLVPLTAVHVADALLETASEFGEADQDRLAMDYLEKAACVEHLGRWRAICDEFRLEGVAG